MPKKNPLSHENLLANTSVAQLRCLCELKTSASLSEVARRTGMAVSTLQRSLKNVEATLGIPVMDWKNKALLPGRAVNALVTHAEITLKAWTKLIEMGDQSGGIPSTVQLTVPQFISSCATFAHLVQAIQDSLAPSQLQILECPGEPQLDLLLNHNTDFAIGFGKPLASDIEHKTIACGHLYALIPQSHPLSSSSSISPTQLLAHPLVTLDPAHYPMFNKWISDLFRHNGNYTINKPATRSSTIVSMVADANYWAISIAVGHFDLTEDVVPVPIQDSPEIDIRLYWRKNMRSGLKDALELLKNLPVVSFDWVDQPI